MNDTDKQSLKECLTEVATILRIDGYKLIFRPMNLRRVLRGLYVAVSLLSKEHGVVNTKAASDPGES